MPSNSDFNPEDYLNPTDKTFSLQLPTVENVKRFFKTIDENKSVGLDKIPNKLLKIAADVVAPEIFIQSINTGIFPNEWKEASVSSLYKHGVIRVKTDPCNYRSKSLIPTVSKIYEKIIYDQLYDYVNANNLLTISWNS